MTGAPSYVDTLNTLAVGEARGRDLYEAWAAATPDAVLARTLRAVAIREGEHAAAFRKRLCELGYSVGENQDAGFTQRLTKLRSNATDLDKFESVLGFGREH